jgi:hypothetical protein
MPWPPEEASRSGRNAGPDDETRAGRPNSMPAAGRRAGHRALVNTQEQGARQNDGPSRIRIRRWLRAPNWAGLPGGRRKDGYDRPRPDRDSSQKPRAAAGRGPSYVGTTPRNAEEALGRSGWTVPNRPIRGQNRTPVLGPLTPAATVGARPAFLAADCKQRLGPAFPRLTRECGRRQPHWYDPCGPDPCHAGRFCSGPCSDTQG